MVCIELQLADSGTNGNSIGLEAIGISRFIVKIKKKI